MIAHGVAPNDHFATGLALALRERWPAMVRDFRHYIRAERPKAGSTWAWPTTDGQRIVSLLTQEGDYGQGTTPGPAQLEHVRHALRALRQFVEREGVTSVAIPKVGTGVGGLDWADVRPIIEAELGTLQVPVYVYATYRPGQAAVGAPTVPDHVAGPVPQTAV